MPLSVTMPLRTYVAADGNRWSVWRAELLDTREVPMKQIEWLAFVDERGREQWRLFEIPTHWEDLSPARLERLRQRAEPASDGVRLAYARAIAQRESTSDVHDQSSRSA